MTDVNDMGVVDFLNERRKTIAGQAGIDANEDPDQAASAKQMAATVNVPPEIVNNDYKNILESRKAALASSLVESNEHLQEYVSRRSLNSIISNDDWHTLDALTDTLKAYTGYDKSHTFVGSLRNFSKGFNRGYGTEAPLIGKWVYEAPPVPSWGFSGGKALYENAPYSFWLWALAGAPLEVPMRGISGLFAGAGEGAGAPIEEAGRELKMPLLEQAGEAVRLGGPELAGEAMTGAMAGQFPRYGKLSPFQVMQRNAALRDAIEPWIAKGREPLPGVDPAVDTAKIVQAEVQLEVFDRIITDSQQSTTKGLPGKSFEDFIRIGAKDREVEISPDVIRKLYGDKEPTLEDGLLGWVPDLADRLRTAEVTGENIRIPLEDFVAKVDPAIYRELRDDLQLSPTGFSLNEAKDVKAKAELTYDEQLLAEAERVGLTGDELAQFLETGFVHSPMGTPVKAEAAVKVGEKVYTGTIHGDAYSKAFEELGQAADAAETGWKLPDGRFLTGDQMFQEGLVARRQRVEPTYADRVDNAVVSLEQASGSRAFAQKGVVEDLRIKEVVGKGGKTPSHSFVITDNRGKNLVVMLVDEIDGGKGLYVGWIAGKPTAGAKVSMMEGMANIFSQGAVRSLGRQLRQESPDAKYV